MKADPKIPPTDLSDSLVIVQAQATQLDGPFYRYLSSHHPFKLSIYYLQTGSALRPYDPELRRNVHWDNDVSSGYSFRVYPRGWRKRLQLGRSIVKARPSLIILCGFRSPDLLFLLLCATLARVPVGLRLDNCFMQSRPASARQALRSFALRRLLTLYSTAHPVGTLAAEYLLAHGMSPAKIFRFPYLVDREMLTTIYALSLPNRSALRRRLGIEDDHLVVLGVMKFVEREDPLTLVRAWLSLVAPSRTPGTLPPVHLLLVGEGPLRPEIERLIRDAGVSSARLPGFANYRKLPEYFAMADVLVHPASGESWGVTVNEALVCGLPVIAAQHVGSARDLIRNGVEGLTFPTGDWRSLAALLNVVLGDKDLLPAMTARCRASEALAPFTYSVVGADLERAIAFVARPS